MKKTLASLLSLSTPTLALAHESSEHALGFIHGFGQSHGDSGYFLAMVVVGLLASYLWRRAR